MPDPSGHANPWNAFKDDDSQATDGLRRLSALALAERAAFSNVLRKTEELDAAKTVLRELREQTIPELMKELHTQRLVTEDGFEVTVEEKMSHSIAGRQAEAHAWLERHDLGGIIKRHVFVDFAKDEEEKAAKLVKELAAKELVVGVDRRVESSTLGTTLRSLLNDPPEGVTVPHDVFGIYVRTVATVKLPKEKKGNEQ
jgi:hypothetical protein